MGCSTQALTGLQHLLCPSSPRRLPGGWTGEREGRKSLHQLCFLFGVMRGQQPLQEVKLRPGVPVATPLGDKVSEAFTFI